MIYELTVKSSTSQLAAIRAFIQAKAQTNKVPQKAIEEIVLAVDEAATNIVKHAYHYDEDKDINIRVSFARHCCTITLSDFGESFDPSMVPEPNMQEYLKQRRVGGLGLFLIRTLMDSMEYRTGQDKTNQLTIKKKYS